MHERDPIVSRRIVVDPYLPAPEAPLAQEPDGELDEATAAAWAEGRVLRPGNALSCEHPFINDDDFHTTRTLVCTECGESRVHRRPMLFRVLDVLWDLIPSPSPARVCTPDEAAAGSQHRVHLFNPTWLGVALSTFITVGAIAAHYVTLRDAGARVESLQRWHRDVEARHSTMGADFARIGDAVREHREAVLKRAALRPPEAHDSMPLWPSH